jgi:hypothetical protein
MKNIYIYFKSLKRKVGIYVLKIFTELQNNIEKNRIPKESPTQQN